MNTTGDMQIEMVSFYHCNEFVYNHDFEQFFQKVVYNTLIFVVLDSNVYFSFRMNKSTIYKIITIFNNASFSSLLLSLFNISYF